MVFSHWQIIIFLYLKPNVYFCAISVYWCAVSADDWGLNELLQYSLFGIVYEAL